MKPTRAQLVSYIEQGLSQREIADLLGSTQTTISRHMRKHKLQPVKRSGPRPGSKTHLCKRCGETDPTKFRNHWFSVSYCKCKQCHAHEQAARYRDNRLRAIEEMGGQCTFCGYKKYHGSLHFHHLDPSQKDPQWKLLKAKPYEDIKEELSKCILVCANCHGELHAGLISVADLSGDNHT